MFPSCQMTPYAKCEQPEKNKFWQCLRFKTEIFNVHVVKKRQKVVKLETFSNRFREIFTFGSNKRDW